MTFVKGEFQPFKAITRVHIGALESNLEEGEVILFDGSTLKRGKEETAMSSIRGAIRVGWLVPEAVEATYRPKPADIKIHSAINMGGTPKEIKMEKVYEDERALGTIQEVRPNNAPKTHVAKHAGSQHGDRVDTPDGEGRVVGTFKTSAISRTMEIGRDDRSVVKNLDNKEGVETVKVAIATGDVQEAITGDNLEEILPNAASTKKPAPGIAGEGTGDLSEERAADFVEKEIPLASNEVSQIKIEMLKSLVPGFEWDLKAHWKTRVRNTLTYKDNPPVLSQILSFESETVVKHVNKKLLE